MIIRLTWEQFVGTAVGRWLFYEVTAGAVVRTVDVDGRVGPHVIFEFDPPADLAEYRQRFPESREVTKIMADASLSNPNVIIEPTANNPAFTVSVVTITTAGTPQQLPSIVVPDGRALVVASTADNDPKKKVFVATSSANALAAASRTTLFPGNSVKLYVDNADKVWVNTDQNGQRVDVIVEQ